MIFYCQIAPRDSGLSNTVSVRLFLHAFNFFFNSASLIASISAAKIAAFSAPLSGLGGGSAVVFASGFLSGNDPAFGLFAALDYEAAGCYC